MRQRVGFVVAAAVLSVAAAGCSLMEYCPMHMALKAIMKSSKPAETTAAAPADAPVGQTRCPVMGGRIDRRYYADYNGTRVYFCCPACNEKFVAAPEKYLARLNAPGQ